LTKNTSDQWSILWHLRTVPFQFDDIVEWQPMGLFLFRFKDSRSMFTIIMNTGEFLAY